MNNRLFQYEKQRGQIRFKYLPIIILVSQLFSLLFFTLIGQLDNEGADFILQDPIGLIGLSNTVTLAVITIYSVFMMNQFFLIDYIGSTRERTYSYPFGRTKVFLMRLVSSLKIISFHVWGILLGLNILFGISKNMLANKVESIHLMTYLLSILIIVTLTTLMLILLITVSLLIGFLSQSLNVSLICSVLLVAVLANVIAISYSFGNTINTMTCVILLLLNLFLIYVFANQVRTDHTLL